MSTLYAHSEYYQGILGAQKRYYEKHKVCREMYIANGRAHTKEGFIRYGLERGLVGTTSEYGLTRWTHEELGMPILREISDQEVQDAINETGDYAWND